MSSEGSPDSAARAAYAKALRLLARQARSTVGLSRRLLDGGVAPAIVDGVIAKLLASRLLDDEAYARARARAWILERGRSRRRVLAALGAEGVPRDVAQRAVASVVEEHGDTATDMSAALRAGEKKLRSLRHTDRPTARSRLSAFLARQGYDGDTIRAVTERLLASATLDD